MKQTAIEWLMIRLPRGLVEGYKDAFEEAKAIEKEQIVNAVNYGCPDWEEAEQYYNETYNK
jgi:hypothetical protein